MNVTINKFTGFICKSAFIRSFQNVLMNKQSAI